MIRIKNNTNKQLSKKCNKVNEWQLRQKRYNDFFTIKKIFQCEFPLSDFLSLPISNSVQPKKKKKRTNKQTKKLLN